MDEEVWQGRKVLVTGHTGFKGAWLAAVLRGIGAHVFGYSLAPEHAGGAFDHLDPSTFARSEIADIRASDRLGQFIEACRPEIVFHLAAQSLVRRSFAEPVATFDVNVLGTARLLDEVARCPSVRTVVVVTSDKVYANDGEGRPFREGDPLGGSDPYSASKAAAELVVRSWRQSFSNREGFAVVTGRAGNVIGGGDMAIDRLVPDFFRALEAGAPLEVRQPGSVRPWQFVLEPLFGYLALAAAAWREPDSVPDAVNFGPDLDGCWTVEEVVDALVERCGRGTWTHRPSSEPEASVLRLDAALARERLGWSSQLTVATALDWTADWWAVRADPIAARRTVLSQIALYREMISP